MPRKIGFHSFGEESRTRVALSWVFFGALAVAVGCVAAPTPLEPLPAPANVAAAPDGSPRTASGLAYQVLITGSGDTFPGPSDSVNVDYTGWTTDGVMFDSSVQRGRSSTFSLDQVIAGWTEGLQLMRAGDEFRFWIPQRLAYRGVAGRPMGTLVFDVKLIQVYPNPN